MKTFILWLLHGLLDLLVWTPLALLALPFMLVIVALVESYQEFATLQRIKESK